MSPSHRRASAQHFAEFGQNFEMCTPKLERSYISTIFSFFSPHVSTPYIYDLSGIVQKLSFDSARKSTFRMSGFM